MVVSSETPRHSFTIVVHLSGSSLWTRLSRFLMTCSSWEPDGVLTQSLPSSSSQPLWMRRVTSPPSSTTSCGPLPPGKLTACRVRSQYSSSVSPFQAKTGVPLAAMAAAAWSCVEKMLHEAQRTSAPSSLRVSMRTAVWMVMCRQPAIRAPFSGFSLPYCSRSAIRPGISASASSISLRPQSARPMSFTL